jgi:hypothetical protein
MKTKKIKCFCDPGHGWAKVKKKELTKLGIENKISGFSYQKGDYVFLEEDCDLAIYAEALKASGVEPKFNVNHSDRQSRIRNYQSYIAPNKEE